MGYKRVTNFWCDCCGNGCKMINSIQQDTLDEVKKTVLSCGWLVNEQNQMICTDCQREGKTFDDCVEFNITPAN